VKVPGFTAQPPSMAAGRFAIRGYAGRFPNGFGKLDNDSNTTKNLRKRSCLLVIK